MGFNDKSDRGGLDLTGKVQVYPLRSEKFKKFFSKSNGQVNKLACRHFFLSRPSLAAM